MNDFLMFLPLVILALTFIFRIPLGIGMVGASVVYLITTGADFGLVMDQVMGKLYSNTVLVAIPLFIFAANIMNSGKISEYMYTFAKALIGPRRGATAYMNILVSLIFSGMTGSAMADACGTGVLEIYEMKKDGYDGPFSCALSAASATVGPTFPPSIPMVIYAMMAGVSVGQLFLGGIIPALLMCGILGVYVWYISKKRNYPRGKKYTIKEFFRYSLKALPALITPVILLGGIYSGIVTATEAGVLAAAYSIIVAIIAYKALGFKSLMNAVKDTIIQTGIIMAIIAGATILSYVVTVSGLGNMIAGWFLGITDNKYVFLLVVNVLFLFIGMIMDTAIIQYILIPLVLPIAMALGVNLVQFGVVVVLNMMIGMVSPPYGVLCFVTAGMTGEPLKKIFKEVIPMVVSLIVVLLLITYIPDIIMFIPNLVAK
jgi:tripartite ATP-independent transporter DctM subunit